MVEKSYQQMKQEYIEFYNRNIKPIIPKIEKKRKENALHTILGRIILISFPLAFICGYLKLIPFAVAFGILTVLPVFAFLILGSYIPYHGNIDIDRNLKNRFMLDLLKIFSECADWKKGLSYKYGDEKIKEFRLSHILSFLYVYFDDTISLTHKDVKINIFEIDTNIFNVYLIIFLLFIIAFNIILLPIFIMITLLLLIRYEVNLIDIITHKAFKGIVAEININKHFKGHTFFREKSERAKGISFDHKKYENINLESTDFMNKYDVYSTNQVEARYLLTTAMIERLNTLKLAFNANYIRGSFRNNKLILAINTSKDMFAMGNDFKESNNQTFIDLYNEIVSVMKIIDQLKLYEKTGL